ncbi:uncharacterized protein SPSC_05422 [Sporisorium scitamineum]|uniref:Uncharacterized protein n=1 Tax=Sporisorium scitamineum TaxID=49012 RepID=A0A127ZHE9_9BASI|nr:uncharacterized protein SPSC_05422 [Sporisorium scitamineum]
MDAWSSPWGDDGVPPSASTSKHTQDDGVNSDTLSRSTAVPLSSLNTFDASDPWSNQVATTTLDTSPSPDADTESPVQQDSTIRIETPSFQSCAYTSAAWGDTSSVSPPRALNSPIASASTARQLPPTDSQTRTSPTRQRSLSSYDPWAADSSSAGWGAEQSSSSSALPTSNPEAPSTAWAATDLSSHLSDNLEHRLSSTHLNSPTFSSDPEQAHDATTAHAPSKEQDDTGTNLDVWAAEASSREEKACRLDREEIDRLKVEARKLISSVNPDQETQASFAQPSSSEGGWTDLFGSQGSQRNKLHHLRTPPSSLMSSDGVLRPDILQASPATLNHVRSSIASTENRGVKLASLDNNPSWQRGSRPITKPDWLPDQLIAEADGLAFGNSSTVTSVTASNTMSGPGWMQTSSNETRSASGPSFLASFFKGRQASAANAAAAAAAAIDRASSPIVSQGKESRNSSSSFEASPRVSINAQFEPYQDTAGSKYSDDPSGPDLMLLDTAAASASAAPSRTVPPTAPAQGPGLLSRWRNSGLFKSSVKKQNPSWASASLRGDDLDWLEEHESSDSKTSRYHYDNDADADDSFASFQNNTTQRPPSPPAKEAATATTALDPFDSLFGPAVQTSLQSGASPATSSARSSLSASRMSGEGGMMTITTNLGRANSLARKSAASPLQPPPQVQNKRMSIAPPPRTNAASPRLASPGSEPAQKPAHSMVDPFADFLSDAPSKPVSNASTVRMPPAASAVKAPPANSKGGGLTADDLLFFDNL